MPVNTDLGGAICTMVEAMLPRFTGDKILTLSVEICLNDYTRDVSLPLACDCGPDEDCDECFDAEIQHPGDVVFVNFAFYRPNNYTRVLVSIEKPGDYKDVDKTEWTCTACHDSGWRMDGVGSVLFDKYLSMRDALVEDGSKVEDISTYTSFWRGPEVKEIEGVIGPDNRNDMFKPNQYMIILKKEN
jgi:hypothetical protein